MQQVLASLLVLSLCAHSALSLKCYECSYTWYRDTYGDNPDRDAECRSGPIKCATDPGDTGIDPVTCNTGQVCVVINLVGKYQDGATLYEAAEVERGCIDKPQNFTKSCYNTNDFPRPPNWPDGVEVSDKSEACQCDADQCNNKKYSSAAMRLHMNALWIGLVMLLAYLNM